MGLLVIESITLPFKVGVSFWEKELFKIHTTAINDKKKDLPEFGWYVNFNQNLKRTLLMGLKQTRNKTIPT